MSELLRKCNGCGNSDISNMTFESKEWRCNVCGTTVEMPIKVFEENKALLDVANSEINAYNFEDAYKKFNQMLENNPIDDRAFWGRLLCNYSIRYIKNDSTEAVTPTFAKVVSSDIFNDSDYINALRYASKNRKDDYIKKAEEISELILKTKQALESQPEYDVFISAKISIRDKNGRITGYTTENEDAIEFYNQLTKMGKKVFYSKFSIENVVSSDSQIFSALAKSKTILVIANTKENLESKWVKSEWLRWLNFISSGKKTKNSMVAYLYASDVLATGFNCQAFFRGDQKKVIDAICSSCDPFYLSEAQKLRATKQSPDIFFGANDFEKSSSGQSTSYQHSTKDQDKPKKLPIVDKVAGFVNSIFSGDRFRHNENSVNSARKNTNDNLANNSFVNNDVFEDNKRSNANVANCGQNSNEFNAVASNPFDNVTRSNSYAKGAQKNNDRNYQNSRQCATMLSANAENFIKCVDSLRCVSGIVGCEEKKRYRKQLVEAESLYSRLKSKERNNKIIQIKNDALKHHQKEYKKLTKHKDNAIFALTCITIVLVFFAALGVLVGKVIRDKNDYEFEVFRNSRYYSFEQCQGGYAVTGISSQEIIEGSKAYKYGQLIIPSTYMGKNVVRIESNAFKNMSKVKAVSIPKSIISIGENAFEGTGMLSNSENEMIVVGSVQDNEYIYDENIHNFNSAWLIGSTSTETKIKVDGNIYGIADNAFTQCSQLEEVTIQSSTRYIGKNAFNGAVALKRINFIEHSYWENDKNVTKIDGEIFNKTQEIEIAVFPENFWNYKDDISWSAYQDNLIPLVDDQSGYIVFDSNGGTNSDVIVFRMGQSTSFLEFPKTTKSGYSFGGWYEDKELTKEFKPFPFISKNAFVYAKWLKN